MLWVCDESHAVLAGGAALSNILIFAGGSGSASQKKAEKINSSTSLFALLLSLDLVSENCQQEMLATMSGRPCRFIMKRLGLLDTWALFCFVFEIVAHSVAQLAQNL